MRSLERSFKEIVRKNPNLSTITCFSKTVLGRGFTKEIIKKYFRLLVDKNDYQNSDKGALLKDLYNKTSQVRKAPVEHVNTGQNSSVDVLKLKYDPLSE